MADGPDCHSCHQETNTCSTCDGKGEVWGMFGECTECAGTGWQCPQHGKYWT